MLFWINIHLIRIAPFIQVRVITRVVCLHKLLLSVEPQPISGLGRLVTKIPRSHKIGHKNTRQDSSERVVS
jgi:hypothetical protein